MSHYTLFSYRMEPKYSLNSISVSLIWNHPYVLFLSVILSITNINHSHHLLMWEEFSKLGTHIMQRSATSLNQSNSLSLYKITYSIYQNLNQTIDENCSPAEINFLWCARVNYITNSLLKFRSSLPTYFKMEFYINPNVYLIKKQLWISDLHTL